MPARRLTTALLVSVLAALATLAHAQRIWVGGGGFFREAPKWAKRAS